MTCFEDKGHFPPSSGSEVDWPEAMVRIPDPSPPGLQVPEHRSYTLRVYDAVGPETMSILELNRRFCVLNGRTLQPVFVDYRNFERVLNVASLGNLTRQFVSLLRSEQVRRAGRRANQALVGEGTRTLCTWSPIGRSRRAYA